MASGRWSKRGGFALTILLWIAGVTLLGVLLDRHNPRADLSTGQRRSLSPQTIQLLELLDRPIHILGFYSNESPQEMAYARNVLDSYRSDSSLISYEFVDLDRRPELAALYGVSMDRTLVLTSESLQVNVSRPVEAEITGGVLRLIMERPPSVLFLTGHGEASITDESSRGISRLAEMVRRQNFQVDELALATVDRIPPEIDAIVLAAPEGGLTVSETDALLAYLLQGGCLLAMVEPLGSSDVDSLLGVFGIVPENTFVVDPSEERRNATGSGNFRIAMTIGGSQDQPITQSFAFSVFFPIARSLSTQQPPPPGIKPTRLIQSMPNAWAESDLTQVAVGFPEYEDGVDRAGPLALAYAVEVDLRRFVADVSERSADLSATLMDLYPETFDLREVTGDTLRIGDVEFLSDPDRQARLVVVGDVDFVNNANLLAYGNSDLLMAMLLWLTEQENRIALTPRPELFEPMVLTLNQTRWLRIAFIGGLPVICFLLAILVVWRRRHWV